MKAKHFFVIVIFMSIFVFSLNLVNAEEEKTFKWNFQNTYSGTEWTTTGGVGHLWADIIEKASMGRIEVKVIPPGGLVSPEDTLGAVSRGTVEAAFHYPGFYTGDIPEANIEMGLPFAWESQAEALDAYVNYGLLEEFRDIYKEHNIFWNPVCFDATYALLTTFPIESPEDLKGKKIRASGAFSDWVESFGGSPTVITTGELYMAAKLGTVDGAIISGEFLTGATKLEEIMEYAVVSPNPSSIVANILINNDALNELPDDLKTIVKETTLELINYSAIGQSIGEMHSFFHAEQKYGLELRRFEGKDREKAIKAGVATWDEVAEKSERCAKLIDIIKKQARDYGKLE